MSRLSRLADIAFRRRRLVLAGWVGALIAVLALGNALRGEWSVDYATPGSESKAAVDLLADRFPERGPDSVDVVWQARNAEAPAIQARVDAFIREASRLDGIGDPVPASRADVSRDGTIAIARIPLTVSPGAVPLETGRELIDMAAARSGDGLRLELGGQAIGNAQRGAISSETIGFAIAALVLLLTFGSIVASGLPIATALFGLAISGALVGVLAAVVDTPDWAESVAAMIGIGVGIDYSLLILTRFRTALARGLDAHDATVEAVTHAGRSVLVAGSTVVISMLGLFVVGLPYLYGVALSAIVAVLVVMAASLTLLPALLGFARERVNRLRVPFTGRAGGRPGGLPRRALEPHGAAPPVDGRRRGAGRAPGARRAGRGPAARYPDQGNDPRGTTTRTAYDLVAHAFGPGASGPLVAGRARRARRACGRRGSPGTAATRARCRRRQRARLQPRR